MPGINISNFFSNSNAYFIAVQNYSFPINGLQSPVNDVTALKKILEEKHGFVIENLQLTSGSVLQNPLIDPTGSKLLEFLSNIKVNENDRVIIYFACHGIAINSEGDPEGYLLAADAEPGRWDTFIKMSTILEKINSLPCRHLLLVLDCCYAGAFRWANISRSAGADVPKTIYYERLQQYTTSKAWQVLTSAAHDQKAIDTLRLGKREEENVDPNAMSPFAIILVNALDTGDADFSFGNDQPDGVITITELHLYVQQHIMNELYARRMRGNDLQLPMLFPLIDFKDKRYGKGEFVFLNPAIKNIAGEIEIKSSINKNPYKGFESYTVNENNKFYGRERVLNGWWDGAVENIGLIRIAEHYNLIILTGPSGIGKSSLAKAGLLAFYKGKMQLREIRPGKTPFLSNGVLLKQLETEQRSILLVDQYEELITVCTDENEKKSFEEHVLKLMKIHIIVVTIRSDFEYLFKKSPVISIKPGEDESIKYRFVVPPFSREELKEIVIQPALQEILEFEPIVNNDNGKEVFINKIIDDAFQNPGSLPLLSLALSELYERKEGVNLLESVYNEFGGITGILDKKATQEHDNCDKKEKPLFRSLIFRMISFESGRISKRRVYVDELELEDADRTKRIESIAKKLLNARLLVADSDGERPFYEPAHEALLRSWRLLIQWLKEHDKDSNIGVPEQIQLQKSVSDALINYNKSEEADKKEYLNSWAQHPRLAQLRKNFRTQLNKKECIFIDTAYEKKIKNKKIRIASLCLFLLIISSLSVIAMLIAISSSKSAESSRLATEALRQSNLTPTIALRLAHYALKVNPENETAIKIIHDIVQNSQNAYCYKAIKIANTDVKQVIFSPDGKYFITTTDDSIKLWETNSVKLIKACKAIHADVIKFLPDSKKNEFISIAYNYSILKKWNIDLQILDSIKIGMHFQHSLSIYKNRMIIVLNDSTELIDLDLKKVTTLHRHNNQLVESVSLYKDKVILLTNGSLSVCEIKGDQLKEVANKHDSKFISAIFNNETGDIIVKQSTGNTMILDSNAQNKLKKDYSWMKTRSYESYALSDEIYSNDYYWFSLNRQGNLGIEEIDYTYPINYDKEIKLIKDENMYINGSSFSCDIEPIHKIAITGHHDGYIKFWSFDRLIDHDYYLEEGVSFSMIDNSKRDNFLLQYSRASNLKSKLDVWQKNGRKISTIENFPLFLEIASFLPEEKSLLIGLKENYIDKKNKKINKNICTLYECNFNGKLLRVFNNFDNVSTFAISSDGQIIASGNDHGVVKIWTRKGKLIDTFNIENSKVSCISISEDGKYIVAATDSIGTIFTIKIRKKTVLKGAIAGIKAISFTHDGKHVFAIGYRGVRKWDLAKKEGFNFLTDQEFKSLQVSSDDRYLLLTQWWGYTIIDSKNKNVVQTILSGGSSESSKFSNNDTFIYGVDRDVHLKKWYNSQYIFDQNIISDLTPEEKVQYKIQENPSWYSYLFN